MSDRQDFFFERLDAFLGDNLPPRNALLAATEEYAITFFTDDGLPTRHSLLANGHLGDNFGRLSKGEMLIFLREETDLTQAKLGNLAGMTGSAISTIETEKVHPTRESLIKLCNAMRLGGRDRGRLFRAFGYSEGVR